ncbi:MAG: epoxyqueuosine reductase [Candidatus Omnitrophica bacterium]|nr:epoxyqueuosine reductase [Candidatus Omnitrophota bacterium]
MSKDNYRKVKEFAIQNGAALFGAAPTSALGGNVLDIDIKGFDSAISMAVRLSKSILDTLIDHPTKLYYHHYRQANMFLDRLAFTIANFIQEAGFQALPVPASQIVDWENQKAHLSHKAVAEAAGLGWIGRNNLLVNPELGAQIRLITILTDMPLISDGPIKDSCGDCHDCVDACPAGAIKKDLKDFDHQACYQKLKEFRKLGFTDQFICGICVKNCHP